MKPKLGKVLAQYEQTILVAFREVEDALVAVRKTRDQTVGEMPKMIL